MKSIARIAVVTAVCASGAFGLPAARLFAAEGVLIVQTTTTGDKVTTNQVQIENTKMRAEIAGANGESQVMVFDGQKQVLTMINTARKTYSEMTKEDADRMGSQMSDAMAKMQAQMAAMPPAQRAQMEAMMRGRMGAAGAAAPKTQYRKTGVDKVGRWTCDKYDGYLNEQKVSELCTVDPKALGLAMTDFAVAQQMAEFFRSMMPQASEQIFANGTLAAQGYNGIPVRRITFSNGKVQSTSEMKEITRQNFAASSYAVPDGFQKQATFGGRGGARGRAGAQQ